MSEKHTSIPKNWVDWIRQCRQNNSDFEMTKRILLEHFEEGIVDTWINHIWFSHELPKNVQYDKEFSWMPRDIKEKNGVRVEYLNMNPVVAILHNIISLENCQIVIDAYKNDDRITRATVHNKDDQENNCRSVSKERTNSLMHLQYQEDPIITNLEKTIADVTGIPIENGESCQLLYYQTDQEYTPHDDFFHYQSPATRINECGQRIATVVTYLSNVEEGGGTHFPNLNITVPAVAGTAVYFEYTDSNGMSTTLCRHAGLPVIRGEKWAVSKWLRMKQIMPDSVLENYY